MKDAVILFFCVVIIKTGNVKKVKDVNQNKRINFFYKNSSQKN